jgi:hypothetical protein
MEHFFTGMVHTIKLHVPLLIIHFVLRMWGKMVSVYRLFIISLCISVRIFYEFPLFVFFFVFPYSFFPAFPYTFSNAFPYAFLNGFSYAYLAFSSVYLKVFS